MSHFSEMLDNCILESGLSVNDLSRVSGINRTYISKIRGGSRILRDEDKVRKLIYALRCSAEQEERLLREYRIEVIGREKYEIIEAVKDLLQNIGYAPSTPFIKRELSIMPGEGPIYGKNDVSSILGSVLSHEAAKPNGMIRLIAQHEYDDLTNLLPKVCHNNTGLKVEHITCLRSSNTQGADLYNVKCLKAVMPSIISGCKYDLLYYYGEQSHINNMNMFPFVVITSEHALTIAYDADMAILHTDADIINAYLETFNMRKKSCRPIITRISLGRRFNEYESAYRANAEKGRDILTLSNTPMLVPFITSDILSRCSAIEDMDMQLLISNLMQIYEGVTSKNCVKFFSEDGLKHFIKHGKMAGIPDSLYRPIEKADRLTMLKAWYDLSKTENYSSIMIKPSQMNIPNNLLMEITDSNNILLSYTHPMNANSFYMVLEQSVSACMQEFMKYMQDGNLVYDKGHSLKASGAIIDAFEKELAQEKELTA